MKVKVYVVTAHETDECGKLTTKLELVTASKDEAEAYIKCYSNKYTRYYAEEWPVVVAKDLLDAANRVLNATGWRSDSTHGQVPEAALTNLHEVVKKYAP